MDPELLAAFMHLSLAFFFGDLKSANGQTSPESLATDTLMKAECYYHCKS